MVLTCKREASVNSQLLLHGIFHAVNLAIRNELNIHVSHSCFNHLIGATYESITKLNVNGFMIFF